MFIVKTIFTTNHCTDKPHIFTYFYPNEAQRNAVWIQGLPSCKILLFYTLLSDKRSNKIAAFANSVFIASYTCMLSGVQLFATLQTATQQTPLSMKFSQARILELLAICYSRSSRPRDPTGISCISCIGRWILYHCTIWEATVQIENT